MNMFLRGDDGHVEEFMYQFVLNGYFVSNCCFNGYFCYIFIINYFGLEE